jgi:hypothetical protein
MLTEEQIFWGAASMLLKRHGDRAPLKVTERIGTLLEQGDDAGVRVWREIAWRMYQMSNNSEVH